MDADHTLTKKNGIILAALSVLVIVSYTFMGLGTNPTPDASGETPVEGVEMTIYKSSTCGCCGVYADYAEKRGFDVTTQDISDTSRLKADKGVPTDLQSCHTSIVNGYVVEGHVPVEAINRLLEKEPDIRGIALPGMPSGSPGMPGTKQGGWTIYTLHEDGSSSEFMEL